VRLVRTFWVVVQRHAVKNSGWLLSTNKPKKQSNRTTHFTTTALSHGLAALRVVPNLYDVTTSQRHNVKSI